ncbi:formylglycine-generating enzyme family protein [Maribacter algarum]|uniref:Formylglycine-generating enzyme family protein n=1 Tax=Maribacter algarum (ex Zhang et al. 2020) TaxID=2578118 RepID=A0A5S3PV06_9FLAO|nr:formylglycine-generating enzyme family protein [Maribacter algarum]TMM56778.1 formylglycine-generating enzyme family protein [Maribacter algarum]
MSHPVKLFACLLFFGILIQCKEDKKANIKTATSDEKEVVADSNVEKTLDILVEKPEAVSIPEGMVWIPGGTLMQGAVIQDEMAMGHEKPAHKVAVDGFFMDITEVTNAQFKKFVAATGYRTIAERAIDWEEMKKQLPVGTPRPHDSIMQPGSLTFKKTKSSVPNLYDFSQWWEWKIGANWKQPNGPGSSIKGKDNYPVVHISYDDALAYCKWSERRLPTEAEWERAARGNQENTIFFWGDDISVLPRMANTWEGEFPVKNTKIDGFERLAAVKSYPSNDFGLYDMAGNVWEWTNDWYNTGYYNETYQNGKTVLNPQGASAPYNERDRYARERVIKGGSFLCSESYCASYRISARMANSLDSAQEHLGFRTVATIAMIEESKEKK